MNHLEKRCYYCFNLAVEIRHDTPRCPDHCPPPTKETKTKVEDKGPETPRMPSMFDGWTYT